MNFGAIVREGWNERRALHRIHRRWRILEIHDRRRTDRGADSGADQTEHSGAPERCQRPAAWVTNCSPALSALPEWTWAPAVSFQ
jgi:hypothetical protein